MGARLPSKNPFTYSIFTSADTVIVTFALHHRLPRFASLPRGETDLAPKSQDGATMAMEHRWGERQSIDVTVHVVASSGKTGIARVANVSVTGAYLETSISLRLHSLVYLQASTQYHPHIGGNCVTANVVRQDERGVGLQWCDAMSKQAHVDALLAMLGHNESVDSLFLRRA